MKIANRKTIDIVKVVEKKRKKWQKVLGELLEMKRKNPKIAIYLETDIERVTDFVIDLTTLFEKQS